LVKYLLSLIHLSNGAVKASFLANLPFLQLIMVRLLNSTWSVAFSEIACTAKVY